MHVNIFPTLVESELKISIQEPSEISIYDLRGLKIADYTIEYDTTLNLRALEKGAYFLSVSNKGQVQILKFMKL